MVNWHKNFITFLLLFFTTFLNANAGELIINSFGAFSGGGVADPEDQFATKPVFSVGTTATELDNEGTITVASNIATFSIAFPTSVGAGDVVQYDADNDAAIEVGEYGIIHGISSDRLRAYLLLTDGTGVTNTTTPTAVYDIFRAYISLANWESQTQNTNIDADIDYSISLDLTSGGGIGPESVACYSDGDDVTIVDIQGRTTDADNYIEIFTPITVAMVGTTQRHDGTAGTGYEMATTAEGDAITVNDDYVTINGIEISDWVTGDYAEKYGIEVNASDYVIIKNNIIHGDFTSAQRPKGIMIGGFYSDNCKVHNNIIYNIVGENTKNLNGIDIASDRVTTVYNNTVYGCEFIGIDSAGTNVLVKNNLVYNNTTDFVGSFDAASDFNFSKDDTAPEAAGNSIWGDTDGLTPDFENVGAGTEDFHIQATSDTIGEGVGPGTDADVLTTDIDGDARAGATCDMGADEDS